MASAAGGQPIQGSRQIIMTHQGGTGTPVRSGQILQVTGAGGQVQQIVVSQSGQIILSPQPQQPSQKWKSILKEKETIYFSRIDW